MEVVVPDSISPSEIGEILQRLFYLRNHFKVDLPENLAVLKTGLDISKLGGKVGRKIDYDLFYNVGVIFSRQLEPITMGELSDRLDVPLSTATRIVDWLVNNNYAQRLSDPEDRRIVRVALTEEGRSIYRAINGFLLERVERLMRQFTPQERENLLVLLRKLIVLLENEI